MPIARRTQLSFVFFVIALISMILLLASAVRDAAPIVRLIFAALTIITFSAGVFMRAWAYRPDEKKPPVPLAKLLPPRRPTVEDRNGLKRDLRR
jgi:hypothetical protein